jgi:hypothetical protein
MIEPTQPGQYYHSGTLPEIPIPPPPPSPEYNMHQRTGKIWKVTIPVVLLLFGVAVGILAYPVVNNRINPSSSTSKPTPFVPFSMPAVTPTANTNYTAWDIMKYILNTGDEPWSISYGQSTSGWYGSTTSVNATSSIDFTEIPTDGSMVTYALGILVYKNYADTKQGYEDELKDWSQIQTALPPGTIIGPGGDPYYHGRCLLLGANETSVYAQVIHKYCV